MTGPAEIRLRDLTVSYERMPAVHHLSGAFQGGRLSAVMGPNGAGKSTLLKSLVGLLPLDEGDIGLSGLARREIAYLPQHADLDTSFPITVFDVVAMGLWQELGLFGRIDAARTARVNEALETVGLPGFGERPVTNLSVGQLQRVLFARLLIQD
ncbi:MAG: ATP-binding cassette domain-containing protein, partial [Nitratireductor sp.]